MNIAGGIPARFIPTPVGNAIRWDERAILITVHPHARGERTA